MSLRQRSYSLWVAENMIPLIEKTGLVSKHSDPIGYLLIVVCSIILV